MIIDGKKEAEILRHEIKKEIISLQEKTKKVPTLSVILIGNYAPSEIYVKNKVKKSKEVGINSNIIRYPDNVSENEVLTKIIEGGVLFSNKGVNLPNSKISTPSLTEKDLNDLKIAINNEVDWIGFSFVSDECLN